MREGKELKLDNIRTEAEAWNQINKYRNSRGKTEEEITAVEWFNHFIGLLDGTKDRRGK